MVPLVAASYTRGFTTEGIGLATVNEVAAQGTMTFVRASECNCAAEGEDIPVKSFIII